MAYMLCGEGPYANKAGEWVQNKHVSAAHNFQDKYRVGPPAPEVSLGHTREWLASRGMRGLYLRTDEPMPAGATEVTMPPELAEPVAAGD
jgi:hypothetical protein